MAKRHSWLKKVLIGKDLLIGAMKKRKGRNVEYTRAINSLRKTIETNGLKLTESQIKFLSAMTPNNLKLINARVEVYSDKTTRQLALEGCIEYFSVVRKMGEPDVHFQDFVDGYVVNRMRRDDQ